MNFEPPQFTAWSQQFEPPLDRISYLNQHLTITSAALFSELLMPDLIEVRGCILQAARYTPVNFESWWKATGGDLSSIEGVINRVSLWDVFEPETQEDDAILAMMAERMTLCWRTNAEKRFPGRRFKVEIDHGYGPTVSMSTIR